MSDPSQPQEPERPDLGAPVDELLQDPRVWEEPPPELEDLVVAAIVAEAAARPEQDDEGAADRRPATGAAVARGEGRRWVRPFLAGVGAAAAAAVLVLLVVQGPDDGGPSGGTEVALAGTELAPDASADAVVTDTPQGTVVDLDVQGLQPAPPGTYYEAWLRQEGPEGELVSAGTFHLRGGDGRVSLWAGVAPEDYPLLTVTLQPEGGGPASSGDVVLRGRVG